MANTWYYEIMGDEVGPVSSAELKKLAAGNVIDHDTIVRPASGTTRVPAYRLKGLFPASTDTPQSIAPVSAAPKVQPSRSLSPREDAASSKACPFCAELVAAAAIKCKHLSLIHI